MYSKTKKILAKLSASTDAYTKDELKKLNSLAHSTNYRVRAKVAELLVDQFDEESESTLYHLSYDKVEIVKLEAIDSMCIGKSEMTLKRLAFLCNDESCTVRQFAFQSHYEVYMNINGYTQYSKGNYLKWLQSFEFNEKADIVVMVMQKLKFLCGDRQALDIMIDVLIGAINQKKWGLVSPLLYMLQEIIGIDERQYFYNCIRPYISLLDENQKEIVIEIYEATES